MRILSTSTLPALALSVLLAACSDAAVAPKRAVGPAVPGLPNLAVFINRLDTTSTVKSADITVTPEGGYFRLGRHGVYFPDSSICDPAKSTYGMTEWDEPCVTITEPIDIHAEIDPAKSEWIIFSPDLRFAPTSDSTRWAYLFMYDDSAAAVSLSDSARDARFSINWLPGDGLPAIDESIADPTLRTHLFGETGYIYRRVKHFSGYQVALRSLSLEDGDHQGENSGSGEN